MRLITRADIKGPRIYAGIRDDLRRHIIEHKKHRRVIVGDRVSLVFEDRKTLLFQIEEILRTENITEADKIQDEIDVYNQLMPSNDSLSATLFLELPPDADARHELGKMIGLDEHVILRIGDHAVRADFEPGRAEHDRISAVQYLRFRLPAEARAALATAGTPVVLDIDHPNYRHSTALTDDARQSLAGDLAS
jgi:hypothetical protein